MSCHVTCGEKYSDVTEFFLAGNEISWFDMHQEQFI